MSEVPFAHHCVNHEIHLCSEYEVDLKVCSPAVEYNVRRLTLGHTRIVVIRISWKILQHTDEKWNTAYYLFAFYCNLNLIILTEADARNLMFSACKYE